MRQFLDNYIIVKRAARVYPEHRGRGLATPFHKYVERQVAAADTTSQSKLVYTTRDAPLENARIAKQGYHVLSVDVVRLLTYISTKRKFVKLLFQNIFLHFFQTLIYNTVYKAVV